MIAGGMIVVGFGCVRRKFSGPYGGAFEFCASDADVSLSLIVVTLRTESVGQ